MPSANALTLADQAIMMNEPRVTYITNSLLQAGSVLVDIPFINRKTMRQHGLRWQQYLPTITWARLNETLTATKGKPTPYEEQAYLMRNKIEIDIKLIEDENNIGNPKANQVNAYLMSAVFDTNNKFINNEHTAGNPLAPVGIRARLDNASTYLLESEMKIDAGAVDMTPGAMTASSANTFIGVVQTMLDYMGLPDGDGVIFYANDLLLRQWEKAIRMLGAGAGFAMTKDAFGRSVRSYRNAKIKDIGRTGPGTTRIITSTETSAGVDGASVYTSLYAVAYGDERFMGWQYDSLANSIRDVGPIGGEGVSENIVVDHAFGLLPQHSRCISRAYGIKVA